MQAWDIFIFQVTAVFYEVCSVHKTMSVTTNLEQTHQMDIPSDKSPFLFLRKTGLEWSYCVSVSPGPQECPEGVKESEHKGTQD